MNTHLVFIVYKHRCLFSNIGILKDLVNIDYHNKKLISGKMNSYEGLCKKMYPSLAHVRSCRSFFFPPQKCCIF